MIIFILVCVLLSKSCRQCRRLNIMQAVLFICCCVFILSMSRLTKYVFLFLVVINSFFVNYCASREQLQCLSTPVKILMLYVFFTFKLFRQNIAVLHPVKFRRLRWSMAGNRNVIMRERIFGSTAWSWRSVLISFVAGSRSPYSWSNCTPSKASAHHGNKWLQMNWCLPSVLLSHRGMFCHLMMTAGAPLIAKEGGKGTVTVLHKKVAYKSLFLVHTRKSIYLDIVPLVSCAANDLLMQIQI